MTTLSSMLSGIANQPQKTNEEPQEETEPLVMKLAKTKSNLYTILNVGPQSKGI